MSAPGRRLDEPKLLDVALADFDDLGAGPVQFDGDPLGRDAVTDLDGDGMVGITDFLDLLAAWGACP